jgi:hypothetical protein
LGEPPAKETVAHDGWASVNIRKMAAEKPP